MDADRLPGRFVAVLVVIVVVAALIPLVDWRLKPTDDWVHEQWLYLYVLPMTLVGALAWWLDR